MRFFFFFIFAILHLTILQGQKNWCGSSIQNLSSEEIKALELITQRQKQTVEKSNIVDSVAVTVHIIEGQNQQNPIAFTIKEVEREIERANNVFEGAGIHFFVCGTPRVVVGVDVYNFTTGDNLNQTSYVPNTINIYFVNDLLTDSGQGLCGYAQFPFVNAPEERYIMMNKLCATDGATLIHELGHFYGLFHTHETRFGRELVDGSNCATAGDRLCDTAADPNLGAYNLLSGCNYIGEVTDQEGLNYTPPVSNYMSYAPASCQHFFSREQEIVIQDIHQHENAYIARSCDFYPDFAIYQGLDYLKIRSDEPMSIPYNLSQINTERGHNVVLKVSLADSPEKTGLLIYEERLSLQPGKSNIPLTLDLDFPMVKGSGTYYLKAVIDADNQVIERTERNNNAITTIEVDNSGLRDLTIFPNPAGNQLKIFLRDEKARQHLNIRIYRYDGRLVWEKKEYKSQSEFFRILDISTLQAGFYIIAVNFEKSDHTFTFKFFKE